MTGNDDFHLPTGPADETVEDAWSDDIDWDEIAAIVRDAILTWWGRR